MSEQPTEDKQVDQIISEPQQKSPEKSPGKSVADLLSRVNVTQLTLILLALIFVWQWFDSQHAISDMQQQLAKKIAEMDGSNKANQVLLTQSQNEVRELSVKVATLETRYAEAQNQRAALEALYNDLSVNRDETALAEVEQMLLIAGQQLQLSANVKAALIAMQNADSRLKRMDRPAFDGLRKSIAQDMDKLRAMPSMDITGINLQIDNLLALVDELPLVYQQRIAKKEDPAAAIAPKNETTWEKLSREVWYEVRQLVRIENTGKAEIPLLPTNQEFFLRENLKMRLLSARLSLLSHDDEGYKQDIKTIQAWLARHFDTKSSIVMQMQSGLKKIAIATVNIEIPDVSPSLQAVRNYRLTHENSTRTSSERSNPTNSQPKTLR